MFTLISEIEHIETIARGRGVHSRVALRRRFGPGAWRKMKGIATIRLADGRVERAELHWYEAHGSGRRLFKIKRLLDYRVEVGPMGQSDQPYVVCIKNGDAEDLELRKLYPVVPDAEARRRGFLRVIDESGEDYLYPESYFAEVDLPPPSLARLAELTPS